MRGRGRGAAGASRWKGVDVLNILERSKDAGVEKVVRGGVARWSEESESSLVNEDDTLYVWSDPDLLPNGAVMISARKATFDERHEHQRRRPECPYFHCIQADALDSLDHSLSTRRTSMHTQQASSESESDTDYQDTSQAKRTRTEPKSRRTRQRSTKDDPKPKQSAPVHAVDAEHQSAPVHAVNAEQQSELYDVEAPPHQHSPASQRRSLIDAENSGSISAEKNGSEDPLHGEDDAKQLSAAFSNVTKSMDETGLHHGSQSVQNLSDTSLSQHSPSSAAENQASSDDHDGDLVSSLARRPSSLEHEKGNSAEILNDSLSKRMSDAVVPSSFDTDAKLPADTQHGSYTGKRAGRAAKGKAPVSGRDSDADHRAESHSDDSDQELEHMPELRVVAPSMPSIEDYLPMPFPHKRSHRNAPPAPDPNRVTVVDWIGEQQSFLLDTMRERVDERLTLIRKRNAEERQRLEKKLRSQ
ncbi:hypothetical protein MYAM1_003933 [Malassezia yamatoensis]|uniref:Uncharacterized protein n=1 Tax=Malassezia yamatoensis TaxID=253288 RepID=A0AAJ6CKX2_9BASI|nr:hypothetical protein MYAM1_003933 [Malassezia yamatoensis]